MKKRNPVLQMARSAHLRATVVHEHQKDLFARVEKLEARAPELLAATVARCKEKIIALERAKQSPSDRCLFGKYRELEQRLAKLEPLYKSELEMPDLTGYLIPTKDPVTGADTTRMWKPQRPARSAREIYLERHCEWLTAELARYTRK